MQGARPGASLAIRRLSANRSPARLVESNLLMKPICKYTLLQTIARAASFRYVIEESRSFLNKLVSGYGCETHAGYKEVANIPIKL